MKSILLFLFCLVSASSSFGDTLAQFLTKDSEFTPNSSEQANQATPVANLTVGKLKAGTLFGNGFELQDSYLEGGGSIWQQEPVLEGSALAEDINNAVDPKFSICSVSMKAGSGSMINVQSFSFVYSQFSALYSSMRSGVPDSICGPVEFTLMAKINGGEYISLQTLTEAGGTAQMPWVFGKKLTFDLSSQDIQSKIGSATSVEFNLVGKFGELDNRAKMVHLAFDNVSVDGSVVSSSPSVPEPSSALLCMMGLFPLLRRKRNS